MPQLPTIDHNLPSQRSRRTACELRDFLLPEYERFDVLLERFELTLFCREADDRFCALRTCDDRWCDALGRD